VIMSILDWSWGGASLRNWTIALVVTLVTLAALYLFKRLVVGRLQALARRTHTDVDDVVADLLNRTIAWFYLAVSLFVGSRLATLPETVTTPIRTAAIIVLFLQVALWGNGLIAYWINRYRQRMISQDAAMATTVGALGFISRLALWGAIALMALQNLGLRIDTLIAGLGVGGIAVALAVQNILGDLFASLSIVLDKPFLIGDSITVDQFTGTVEHVGLKTTRVRSLTGEQLIFSNSDLLKSRIRNFKRMQERRIAFTLNVPFDTPPDRLATIPTLVGEIVSAQENVRFERAHFKEIGTYSLNFEVVYWMTTADYLAYMDAQQAINLALVRRFGDAGIGFAFPTQTLYVPGSASAEEKPDAEGKLSTR